MPSMKPTQDSGTSDTSSRHLVAQELGKMHKEIDDCMLTVAIWPRSCSCFWWTAEVVRLEGRDVSSGWPKDVK
jgi:hypothetical protein